MKYLFLQTHFSLVAEARLVIDWDSYMLHHASKRRDAMVSNEAGQEAPIDTGRPPSPRCVRFRGLPNKAPQTEVCCLTVPEVENLKSRCHKGHIPSDTDGEGSFLAPT